MSIADEFQEWFGTLQVKPRTGDGAWGAQVGASVPVWCFWDGDTKQITTADGKSITSDTRVFCSVTYAPSFLLGSKVTLPEDPREYQVVQVTSWPGDDTHLEVRLA